MPGPVSIPSTSGSTSCTTFSDSRPIGKDASDRVRTKSEIPPEIANVYRCAYRIKFIANAFAVFMLILLTLAVMIAISLILGCASRQTPGDQVVVVDWVLVCEETHVAIEEATDILQAGDEDDKAAAQRLRAIAIPVQEMICAYAAGEHNGEALIQAIDLASKATKAYASSISDPDRRQKTMAAAVLINAGLRFVKRSLTSTPLA